MRVCDGVLVFQPSSIKQVGARGRGEVIQLRRRLEFGAGRLLNALPLPET